MGFYCNLLIAHPEHRSVKPSDGSTNTAKTVSIWHICEIIGLDRVTRMEKITAPHFSHIQFGGKQRAAICIVDHLLERLSKKLVKPTKDMFAPAFTVDGAGQLNPNNEHLEYEMLKGREQFVEPIRGNFGERLRPTSSYLVKHNHIISLAEKSFVLFASGTGEDDYQLVDDAPFMWESCSQTAQHMKEMETLNSPGWVEIAKDQSAVCYFRSWQNCLEQMGKLGARTIFLFDRLDGICLY